MSLNDLNQSLIDSLILHEGASIPLKIMEGTYIEEVINNPTHPMRLAMIENNVYDWSPKAPTRLYYCGADEQVPFQNSLIAEETLLNNGAIDLQAININDALDHFLCAVPASLATIEFFEIYQEIGDASAFSPELVEEGLKLYPNPAEDRLTLRNLPTSGELYFYDIKGQLVYNEPINAGDNLIQLGSFRSGIYLVKWVNGEKIKSQKLIID